MILALENYTHTYTRRKHTQQKLGYITVCDQWLYLGGWSTGDCFFQVFCIFCIFFNKHVLFFTIRERTPTINVGFRKWHRNSSVFSGFRSVSRLHFLVLPLRPHGSLHQRGQGSGWPLQQDGVLVGLLPAAPPCPMEKQVQLPLGFVPKDPKDKWPLESQSWALKGLALGWYSITTMLKILLIFEQNPAVSFLTVPCRFRQDQAGLAWTSDLPKAESKIIKGKQKE